MIAIIGLLVLQARAFAADEFKYDPHTCKTDAHGSLYIALGSYVLAVPWGGDVMVDPVASKERQPAPIPEEPEGCPDNPAQMKSYSFLFQWQAAHEANQGIVPSAHPGTDLLQLIVQSPDRATTMDEFELYMAESTCKAAALHQELSNGLTACRIKPVYDVPVGDWGASYIAHPETYTTPRGGRFAVECGPGLQSNQISHCDVAYMVMPLLLVAYRFQPFLGPRALPIDHIIEFDRSLRAKIDSMLVKDYVWPMISSLPNKGPGEKKP